MYISYIFAKQNKRDMKLYNEFQEDLKDPTEWRNAGQEIIFFTNDPDEDTATELFVSEEGYEFDETGLTSDEYWAVDEYAKKVQAHLVGETAEYNEYNSYLNELYKNKY